MFQGYDFTELADAWNMYLPDSDNGIEDYEYMGQYLRFLLHRKNGRSRPLKKAADDIRAYCRAMARNFETDYGAPIWDGFARVESDITLTQYFASIVGHAWT